MRWHSEEFMEDGGVRMLTCEREDNRSTCFSNYEGVVQKVFDRLRPGGWVEYQVNVPHFATSCQPSLGQLNILPCQEFSLEATSDDTHTKHVLQNDPASHQGLLNRLKEGFSMLGRDVDVTHRTKDWLEAAGFVDVVEKRFSVP